MLRPSDAFTPDELLRLAASMPPRCGSCQVCRLAPPTVRIEEYLANLEDHEVPAFSGAVAWAHEAYPSCPTVAD